MTGASGTRAWGSPALLLLLRLKLRGAFRRQLRRLRTPRGLALTLLGVLLFVVWLGGLVYSFLGSARPLLPEEAEPRIRAFGALLTLITLTSALSHRGLFLHKSEIERLFSAPLSRGDLVRYRLLSSSLRSLLGGLILAVVSMRRLPSPPLALAGILLAMQTLPVVNQLVAIALGGLERRAARWIARFGTVLLVGFVACFAAFLFLLSRARDELVDLPLLGSGLRSFLDSGGDLFAHPALARLTLPWTPWARMIAAESPASFAPWFLLCLGIYWALVEGCARLPIDFRELSLATSERVAARLSRVRRGGGAAATRASRELARWRIPWLFGRGPAGAIAWRKSIGLVRKARSTFWVALFALGFLTLFSNFFLDGDPRQQALQAPVLIATFGTLYLCSGLRFDFREDLERMDVIRSWPLAGWRTFLATLLPEVVLVSLLLDGTVLLDAFLRGPPPPLVLGIALCVPCLVFAWVALDNGVFLLAPVRTLPGQEGLLQNAGRGLIRLVLLVLLALLAALVAGGPSFLAGRAASALGGSEGAAWGVRLLVFFLGLLVVDGALVVLGGMVLERFDVARDRA